MTEHVECVVVGAGVVGLAIARQLAMDGREVVILESEQSIGTGVSSRNSEVIHAGLYYPPGSHKARLCVVGRTLLYPYLESRGVPYRRCGKLVVANTEAQLATLRKILGNAEQCGVTDLELIDQAALHALEPDLSAAAALVSPSSGIVDSHALMLALLGDAERHGALLALQSPVRGGSIDADGITLLVGDHPTTELHATLVINAAGLYAQAVAHSIGIAPTSIPEQVLVKGNYFSLSGACPFSHLIYPVPEVAGLGVHLTLDLAGRAKFGPDVQWIEALDYTVDEARAEEFATRVNAYWPGLSAQQLSPAYAGIRPKLRSAGSGDADFVIADASHHGATGVVCLYGIESPGLTSCLAIGQYVSANIATSRT